MNKFLKTSLPLLLLFIIAIAGCNIFPRYGNSKPISTQQPKTVFKTEFSGNNDINFSNSEISLKISKTALDKPQEIKILKYPDSSIIKAPENFDIISCPYQIMLDEKILKTPASISFSLKNDYEVETIFALVQSSKESQPRLISPSFLEGKNKFTFSTSIFSIWCMVQRKEKVATAPVSAPFLSVTPLKLMTDNEGYLSHDVVVKTNFSLATSTTSFNSNDYEFTIELLAEQSFQLEFASQNQSKIFKSVLNSSELHSIAVSIFEQDSVEIDLINNLASATARLKTTSYQPSDLPDVILVKSLIKNKDGILYEANLPLNITEEPDPDLTKSFPVLLSSTPRAGENNFPINEPLIFRFNKPINKQSFITAFSISPEIDTSAEYLSWNQESTAVTFTPQSPLEPLTKYKILLSTDLKDNENIFLKQNIEIDFTTAEASAPVLEDFFPSAEQLLALNGSLQLSFNETIASNSFLYLISPQIETESEFVGKFVTISPLETWPPNTSFEIKLEKGIADLYGNKTEADIIKTFSTGSFAGPKILSTSPAQNSRNIAVSTSITIEFDREIASQTLFESLSFNPSTSYNATFNENLATITPVDKLQFSSDYNLNISTALTDTDGIHFDDSYTLSFKTEAAPAVISVFPTNNSQDISTDAIIKIDFNKTMNPETVQNSLHLLNGLNTVNCNLTWENLNKRLLCQPVNGLIEGQIHTIIINTSAKDSNDNNLSEQFESTFETAAPPSFNVEFISPESDATNVLLNQQIIASFSNSVQTSSLGVEFSPALSSGYSLSWSDSNHTITIIPGAPLTSGQNYTVKILSTTTDIYSQTLTADEIISFTTIDQSAPEITHSDPEAGSFDVPLDQLISITFSKSMNTNSVEQAFAITPEVGTQTTFNWSNANKTLQISFDKDFADGTAYSIIIGSKSKDLNDISMGYDFLLPFSTITRPTLLTDQLYPADQAENIPIQSKIQMTFSNVMNLESVINAFSMADNSNQVAGSFTQDLELVTFTPDQALAYNTTYNLNLDSSAKDTSNNFLKSPYAWSFTTEAQQGEVWTLETDSATFTKRINHSMVSFNNELYIIGGYDGAYLNDVWKSSNGKSWDRILSPNGTGGATQFSPRSGHACTVFNNRIWLSGGMASDTIYHDDVWSSADGITWTQESAQAEYYQRAFHNMEVFDGKLWIMAGETIDANEDTVLLDDCWNSSDGINWVQKSNIVSFFPRKHAGSGVIDNKLWVWGGYGKDSAQQTGALNDSWYTTNGDVWTLANENCAFSQRLAMSTSVFSNKIWMMGGTDSISISGSNYLNEVWTSVDGVTWYQVDVDTTAIFTPRAYTSSAAISNKLFISGGESTSGFFNEVWSTLK